MYGKISEPFALPGGMSVSPLAGPRYPQPHGELEQKLSDIRTQSDSEPPVFFSRLSFVCLVRGRHKTGSDWMDPFAVPHCGAPCRQSFPGARHKHWAQPLGACLYQGAQIPLPVSGGQGNNNQPWSFPCGLNHFLCAILSFSILPSQWSPKGQRCRHRETQ